MIDEEAVDADVEYFRFYKIDLLIFVSIILKSMDVYYLLYPIVAVITIYLCEVFCEALQIHHSYRPSKILQWIASQLRATFDGLGRAFAYISSLIKYEIFYNSFMELYLPIRDIVLSWTYFFGGYFAWIIKYNMITRRSVYITSFILLIALLTILIIFEYYITSVITFFVFLLSFIYYDNEAFPKPLTEKEEKEEIEISPINLNDFIKRVIIIGLTIVVIIIAPLKKDS